ncbi:DUF3800 domain-containing protein [candidate division KSB1 bacterium]|nr:DUF3800 domain-containing protein [candidate division KSB1 bacterium]
MLVFVDEAGDIGFKFSKGSSRLLVVTIVLFEEQEEAKNCDTRIDLLRNELQLPRRFEFHFNQNSPEIRKAFLQAVVPYNFFYFAIVIDKEKFNLTARTPTAEAFYRYARSLVFESAKPYLSDAIVTIDGSGGRDFKRNLQHDLKKRINRPLAKVRYIKMIKVQDSEGNNLIQLADMICGAINRSFSGKPDAPDYRKIIAPREISVQLIPK